MLTEAQVLAARCEVAGGATIAELAHRWGVRYSTLRGAVNGRSHHRLDRLAAPVVGGLGERSRSALSAPVVTAARAAARQGATIAELAEDAGVAYNTMFAAVRGGTWTRLAEPPVPAESQGPVPRRARLTADAVRRARREYASGAASLRELAEHAGVCESTMSGAVHGRSWAHVADPPPVPVADAPGRPGPVQRQESRIRAAAARGESLRRIAAQHGVSVSAVSRLLRGR